MREVYADREDEDRIEIETDGQVTKIGNDIDNDRCVKFTHDQRRAFIDEARAASRTKAFRHEMPDGLRHEFILWRKSRGEYIFYDDDGIILHIWDHEAGPLHRAASLSVEHRTAQFDFERYADEFVEQLLALKRWDIEKTVKERTGWVEYEATDDHCVWIDTDFISEVEESEYASWLGGSVENGDEEPIATYRFSVNGKQLAKDDQESAGDDI